MKKLISVIAATILVGQVWAQHYDFSAVCSSGQTLYYKFYWGNVMVTYPSRSEDGSNHYDNHTKPSGNLIIPNVVSYKGQNYSVESIDEYAFHGCDGLTSVTIPNSITSRIGSCAFMGCSALTSVTINCDNDYVHDGMSLYFTKNNIHYEVLNKREVQVVKLEFAKTLWDEPKKYSGDIVIPAKITAGSTFTVTSIDASAFSRCQDLKSVAIPNTVKNMGYDAFRGCYNCTIYCQATTKPSGWPSSWNPSDCEVKWGAAYKFK